MTDSPTCKVCHRPTGDTGECTYKHGRIMAVQTMSKPCKVEGCERSANASRGMCWPHYRSLIESLPPSSKQVKGEPLTDRLGRTSRHEGDCLIYTKGYAQPSGHVNVHYGTRQVSLQRAVWVDAHGSIPAGLVVRHKCDQPRCFNLNHLELGTIADNNRDRDERGRHVALRGEKVGTHKLTDVAVREIRALIEAGATDAALAVRYSVAEPTISRVRTRATWRHVA